MKTIFNNAVFKLVNAEYKTVYGWQHVSSETKANVRTISFLIMQLINNYNY